MDALRIANCSGFYGDRRSAPRELLEGGPIDVLTGDYLAELTMLILWRSRGSDPAKGYATSFLGQMEDCLGLAVDKGVKVVANAGGLNPAGLAGAVREIARRQGLAVRVATVGGDDTTRFATIAKLKAGRLGREVADTCLQFHGGLGYMEETWVARYFRDSRLTAIGGGADEVMLRTISRMSGLTA